MEATRLVLVQADGPQRRCIVEILATCPVTLLGVCATLPAALALLATADLLLLDDERQGSFSDVIPQLRQLYPRLDVLILGSRCNTLYVKHLYGLGIAGYIYREDALEVVLPAGLHIARQGNFYVSPRLGALAYRDQPTLEMALNENDLAVLRLMAQGQTVPEIARKLHVSERTVYRIRTRLRQALGVPTNEMVVDAARVRGLLDP